MFKHLSIQLANKMNKNKVFKSAYITVPSHKSTCSRHTADNHSDLTEETINTAPVQNVCVMKNAENHDCVDKEKAYYKDF